MIREQEDERSLPGGQAGVARKPNPDEKAGLQILSVPVSEFCLPTLTFAVLSSRLGRDGLW